MVRPILISRGLEVIPMKTSKVLELLIAFGILVVTIIIAAK